MLIKLTNIPHPDVNDGNPEPVYVEASAIIMVGRGRTSYPKENSIEEHRQAASAFYAAMADFEEKYRTDEAPNLNDPVAAGWLVTLQKALGQMQQLEGRIVQLANRADFHPRVDCTSITILVRDASWNATTIHVMESPEEVAALIVAMAAAVLEERIEPYSAMSALSGPPR